MQWVYEWHNHIGAAAMEAVRQFWGSDKKYKDSQEHKKYVNNALELALLFIYGEVNQASESEGTWKVSVNLVNVITVDLILLLTWVI